ncbi:MAG: hypothetical protein KDE57_06825 [Calditrichaeota bacterium]|nr:hypothetical protein [Calditrichota bacterium]MCB9068731.1 hypothetical protein [Calditrichia bacterium]
MKCPHCGTHFSETGFICPACQRSVLNKKNGQEHPKLQRAAKTETPRQLFQNLVNFVHTQADFQPETIGEMVENSEQPAEQRQASGKPVASDIYSPTIRRIAEVDKTDSSFDSTVTAESKPAEAPKPDHSEPTKTIVDSVILRRFALATVGAVIVFAVFMVIFRW